MWQLNSLQCSEFSDAFGLRSHFQQRTGLRVLVAISNQIVRRGLCDMLRQASGIGAVSSCKLPPPGTVVEEIDGKPDVVIVSAVGDMAGVAETSRRAKEMGIKVLILLEGIGPDVVRAVGEISSDGYLLQEDLDMETLDDTLRRIERGEFPIPGVFGRCLIAQAREPIRTSAARPVRLTPREQKVLELIAEGLSNKQIARRFAISEHGVKRHVTNLLAKLNCPNRTYAASIAIQQGLVTSPAQAVG